MGTTESEHIKAHGDLNRAFDTGEIFTAPAEDLRRYLRSIGTIPIQSDAVRTKAVIRALTINYIQMDRVITDLNRENAKKEKIILLLAFASLIATMIGIIK